MNNLFTEKETREIFERSLWQAELSSKGAAQPEYEEFVYKFDLFCNAFPMKMEDTYLFGKRKKISANDCESLPFALFIEQQAEEMSRHGSILAGAFEEWEEAMTGFVYNVFGLISYHELEDAVGVMTIPNDSWVKEKALTFVLEGKQFRNMALKYPIYARQMMEFVWDGIAHIKEVIDALSDELPNLYPAFFSDGQMPGISRVSAASSDRHNGGRSVHLITFEDGKRIVYKPRKLSIDRAFNRWLNWCADKAGYGQFYTLKAEDTKKGGFCEFAKAQEICKEEDIPCYFKRLGFLLGTVYLLRGSDLHAENIIACGKEPVIIDTETLLSPDGCLLERLMTSKRHFTVNDMAILPMMGLLPGMYEAKYASLCYTFEGTHNLPVWKGQTISGSEYADCISEGFSKALCVIRHHRKEAEKVLMDCFLDVEIRMVLKATSFYMMFLISLGNKCYQENSENYLKLVKRTIIHSDKTDPALKEYVFSHELMAYDRLDIPYFADTLNKDMLQGLVKYWDEIDEDRIKNETARIRFGLEFHGAGEKKDIKVPYMDSGEISRKTVKTAAEKLAGSMSELLQNKLSSILMPKGQDKYIIQNNVSKMDCLLDAGLGAAVALAAFLKAFDPVSDFVDEFRHTLQEKLKKLTDFSETAPALGGRAMGLADGTAGFVLGCLMLYEMSFLTEDDMQKILSNVAAAARDPQKIRFSSADFLYGCNDMLFAIQKIPEELMTDGLQTLYHLLSDRIREEKQYADLTDEEIIQISKAELIKNRDGMISGNHSLRFGNAGVLYGYAQRKDSLLTEEKKQADRLLKYLCTRQHILEKVDYPGGCMENGLLHGMPGVLYSICRYYAPDRVPDIL